MGHRSSFPHIWVTSRAFVIYGAPVDLSNVWVPGIEGVPVNFLTVILGSLAMSYPLLGLDPHRGDAGEAMDNTVLEGKGQEGCVP